MRRTPAIIRENKREEEFNAVFQAIGKAEEAPTKRVIALETGFSSRQVHRIINELRDRDLVQRYRDDEDGRLFRYEIVPTGENA